MLHEDDDWDLNAPARVKDSRSYVLSVGGNAIEHERPQAESAVETGNRPAQVPTSPDQPDGRVPYA